MTQQLQAFKVQVVTIDAASLEEAKSKASDQKAGYVIFAELPADKGHSLKNMAKHLPNPLAKAKPAQEPAASVTFVLAKVADGATLSTIDQDPATNDEEIAKQVAVDFVARLHDDIEGVTGTTILKTNRPRLVVQTAHSSLVVDFVYSRDGQVAATLGADGVLKIWAAAAGKELRTFAGYTFQGVGMSADGKFLATVDHKGTVRIIDTHLGVILHTVPNKDAADPSGGRGLLAFSGKMVPVVFSPDGRLIVHGGSRGAWMVDAKAGRNLGGISSIGEVSVLALDPSAQYLAVAPPHSTLGAATIQVYRTADRKQVGDPFYSYVGTVTAMAFDSNGSKLFVGSKNGSIRTFDPQKGEEIEGQPTLVNRCDKPFEAEKKLDPLEKKTKPWKTVIKVVPGLNSAAKTVDDAKSIGAAATQATGFGCEALDVANKVSASGLSGLFYELSPAAGIRSLDITADGSVLAYGLNNNSIKVHHMGDSFDKDLSIADAEVGSNSSKDGKELPRIMFAFLRPPVKLSVNGNRYYVNAIREFKTVNRWDASSGQRVSSLAVAKRDLNPSIFPMPMGAGSRFSKDGHSMITSSLTHGIKLWDLRTGSAEDLTKTPTLWSGVPVSADGNLVVDIQTTPPTEGGEKPTTSVVVKEVGSGRDVFKLSAPIKGYALTDLSDDARFIAIQERYGEEKGLKVYETKTAQQQFAEKSAEFPQFSPDGSYLAFFVSGKEESLRVIKTSDWKSQVLQVKLKSSNETFFNLTPIVFDADSAHIAVVDDGKIKVWDLQSGQLRQTSLKSDPHGSSQDAAGLIFRPGKHVISYTTDRALYHWDYDADKTMPSRLSTDFWGNLSYSPDGQTLALGGSENRIRLFNVEKDEEIGSLVSPSENDWMMITPDGRLDVNRLEEIDEVHWILYDDPLKAQPLELFSRDFYEPRLLPRLLNHETFPEIPDLAARNRALPEVEITNIAKAGESSVKVTVEVRNAASTVQKDASGQPVMSGAQRLRLFRDGRLVGSAPKDDGAIKLDQNGNAVFDFTVALPNSAAAKKIDFSAYAFNSELTKSLTAHKDYEVPAGAGAAPKGRAYVISIGVNANQVETFRLNYAANDAALISSELSKRLTEGQNYREVISIGLISDSAKTLELAKKDNVKAVLDVLAGRATAVPRALTLAIPATKNLKKATPDDLVLVSFAGHGFADDAGKFYLLPSDLGADQGQNIDGYKPRAISSDELSQWLTAVDAHDLVMIIDACQSAAAVDSGGFKPGPMGSRGLGQLAYDKGMEILAATQKSDVAIESSSLGHGILTYALVEEGLIEKRADFRPIDRKIMLSEWLLYAAKRVPDIGEDLRTGKLKQRGVAKTNPDKPVVQSPALFNFQWKREDTLLTTLPAS